MDFFAKMFDGLANLSAKLPSVGIKESFIIVLAVIAIVGVLVGLTYFFSPAFKLKRASKKISHYLKDEDCIDDDNVSDFTSICFSASVPQMLRDMWVEYLGVRFGYPSDLVNESEVYDKEVKKVSNIRANIFIAIALILIACFAFWGFGNLNGSEMSVIHCCGLFLSGAIYLALLLLGKALNKTALKAFYAMQEDLDVKVNLQVEKNYSTDCSPLVELAVIIDEIIAKNTSKVIEISEEMNEHVGHFDDEDQEINVNDSSPNMEQLSIEQFAKETEIAESFEENIETEENIENEETYTENDNTTSEIVDDEEITAEIQTEETETENDNTTSEIVDDKELTEETETEETETEETDIFDSIVYATIDEQKNIDEVMMVDANSVLDDSEEIAEQDIADEIVECIAEQEAVKDQIEECIVEQKAVKDQIEEYIAEQNIAEQEVAIDQITEEDMIWEKKSVADRTAPIDENGKKNGSLGKLETTLNMMDWKF